MLAPAAAPRGCRQGARRRAPSPPQNGLRPPAATLRRARVRTHWASSPGGVRRSASCASSAAASDAPRAEARAAASSSSAAAAGSGSAAASARCRARSSTSSHARASFACRARLAAGARSPYAAEPSRGWVKRIRPSSSIATASRSTAATSSFGADGSTARSTDAVIRSAAATIASTRRTSFG